MAARRQDRIPCIQACHPSEVAVIVRFACCSSSASNSGSNAPHESLPTSSISAEVSKSSHRGDCAAISSHHFSNCSIHESSSDAIPCLQSTCRNRGLIGGSGRDAATKFTFFYSVRSLLTVPVPKLCLELDREDDSLLFVRVPHECALLMTSSSRLRAGPYTLASLQ